MNALYRAASKLAPGRFHTGVECTTGDFYGGQGRPNLFGTVSPRLQARHEEVLRLGAACYSMEASALFVWCATEGGGIPSGAINAIFANRHTNEWRVDGEELSAEIALEALLLLNADPTVSAMSPARCPPSGITTSMSGDARPAGAGLRISYAPLSGFNVGAVVRGGSGRDYLGANLEIPGCP